MTDLLPAPPELGLPELHQRAGLPSPKTPEPSLPQQTAGVSPGTGEGLSPWQALSALGEQAAFGVEFAEATKGAFHQVRSEQVARLGPRWEVEAARGSKEPRRAPGSAVIWASVTDKVEQSLGVVEPDTGYGELARQFSPASEFMEGLLAGMGQRYVELVETHREALTNYGTAEEAALAAAAFEATRWDYAVNHGLLAGQGDFAQAARNWKRLQAGESIHEAQQSLLQDRMLDFARTLQTFTHPELANPLDTPLVQVQRLRVDEDGVTRTELRVLRFQASQSLEPDEVNRRLRRITSGHPGALVELMSDNLANYFTEADGERLAKPAKGSLESAALGFQIEGFSPSGLDRAVGYAAERLGVSTEELVRVVTGAWSRGVSLGELGIFDDRIRQLVYGSVPFDFSQVGTRPVRGPASHMSKVSTETPKATTDSVTLEVGPDGTIVALADGGYIHGLAPTRGRIQDRQVYRPVKPSRLTDAKAEADRLGEGISLYETGQTEYWRKTNTVCLSAPEVLESGNLGALALQRVQRELEARGVTFRTETEMDEPTPHVRRLEGGNSERAVELALEFDSLDDLHRAWEFLDIKGDEIFGGGLYRQAYVGGPMEAPPGTKAVLEEHSEDAEGRHLVSRRPGDVARGSSVLTWVPEDMPQAAPAQHRFSTTPTGLTFDGRVEILPPPEGNLTAGNEDLFSMRLNDRPVRKFIMAFPEGLPPVMLVGNDRAPIDEELVALTFGPEVVHGTKLKGGAIQIDLPADSAGRVDQTGLAYDAEALLVSLGVESQIRFRGKK